MNENDLATFVKLKYGSILAKIKDKEWLDDVSIIPPEIIDNMFLNTFPTSILKTYSRCDMLNILLSYQYGMYTRKTAELEEALYEYERKRT